jgi:hypothetical protein
MIKFYIIAIVITFVIAGCTSSQFVSYRPAGSSDPNWEINVYHTSGVTQNFEVVINDSTVINSGANFLTGNLEEKGTYKGREVKLIVTYTSGFLGIGAGYEAMVFISNELAGKFKF